MEGRELDLSGSGQGQVLASGERKVNLRAP
jgi:hypothetical protein